MNRLINSICHRLSPLYFKITNRKINNSFLKEETQLTIEKKEILYSQTDIFKNLTYKDETWGHIKYLETTMWNEIFRTKFFKKKYPINNINNTCKNTKVVFTNNKLKCKSKGKKNDWIFLKFNKRLSEPYLIEFEAKITNEISEFQFAFKYNNLGSRYRFNFKENKTLSFEVVTGGFFHNDIVSVPLELQLNTFYNFKIIVDIFSFHYIVNDKLILSIKQVKQVLNEGELAFILWDSKTSHIEATYKNINIYKLQTIKSSNLKY